MAPHRCLNRAVASCALMLVLLTISCGDVTGRSWNLPSICLQAPPRSEGICTMEIEGYYFEPRLNDCQMYVVGGCRSSPGQSFGSRDDCLATCVHQTRRIQDLRINE